MLGRGAATRPARLEGHAVHWAEGRNYPVIRAEAGAVAEGRLLEGIGAAEAARLDYYEAGFGYAAREIALAAADGTLPARTYFASDPEPAGAPWDLAAWQREWGDLVTEAAREVMALRGTRPPATVFARYPQILVRAAARLRAAPGGPLGLRRQAQPADVAVAAWRQPYAHFFALEESDLRFRRFDGTMSEVVNRAVFVSGDAATVLPYDPARDRVLVVEQFRAGPHGRGDSQPWLLEPIAGRVDPGESPEAAARREAREEAGIELGEVLPVAGFYPSPGAKSEFVYAFLGLADLPDGWHGGGAAGLAEEHEDIRAHVIGFERLMALVESGEANNGPLLISALFLARRRAALRRPA